ncbi:AmmeMemoRadiSam system radical SAM enzyme [Candidatus Woesearchaeota archaeon]|nr:AmmeMemoRadiSam system radical SAM enzyme [Candidatus Woesearchaeota archaeon]
MAMHEASFYEELEAGKVRCLLCPRRCVIAPGKKGVCGVRENRDGKLYSLVYGRPCSFAVDPVEKKPLYHFLPGQKVFSLATVGCNLFCRWCQNWEISHPEPGIIAPYGDVSPAEVVRQCEEQGCSIIAFTYTEPTIFYEYMVDVAKLAREAGVRTVMVSNGYIEEKPLRELIPYLDAANIDLKMFSDEKYLRWTSAELEPVLRTLRLLREKDVHLEMTTLVVPGVNDSDEELEELYAWVAKELGEDQVVHVSRFFPAYKVVDKEPTPMRTLERAVDIAKKHVRYVYLGNVAGKEETVCPKCGKVVVRRAASGVDVSLRQGKCSCGERIIGVWE